SYKPSVKEPTNAKCVIFEHPQFTCKAGSNPENRQGRGIFGRILRSRNSAYLYSREAELENQRNVSRSTQVTASRRLRIPMSERILGNCRCFRVGEVNRVPGTCPGVD